MQVYSLIVDLEPERTVFGKEAEEKRVRRIADITKVRIKKLLDRLNPYTTRELMSLDTGSFPAD